MARRSELGSALVTVLVMVAAMSVLAVGISGTVHSSTVREKAASQQAQARFYAYATEAVIKAELGRAVRGFGGELKASMPGFLEPAVYPVTGGTVALSVRDHSNCLNLNSLVGPDAAGGFTMREGAQNDFLKVADALEFEQARAQELVAAIIDWMDSDTSPGIGGAEDSFYLGEKTPHMTSGQPLWSLAEMNMIRHADVDVKQALRPVLCALPNRVGKASGPFNVNTLTVEQASLLTLIFGDELSVNDAETLIASRPVLGWASVEEFLTEPKLAQIAPEIVQRDRLSTVSSHLSVLAEITYRGQVMRNEYLLSIENGQPIGVISRERVG